MEQTARRKDLDPDELIATVSHDMRVPLAAIKGYSETLRRGALADPRCRGRFIRVIERHADALLDLVEDLLLFATLDHGRPCESQVITVRQGVLAAIHSLRQKARKRRVRVKEDIAPDLKVAIDPRRLSQVLQNLISNSIKYNRRGGRVDISARRVASMVQVDVSDTGIGIERDQLPLLFKRFHRAPAARLRCPGTGLGLSIVKRIVGSHGGQVWVESIPGSGSTFSFTLPVSLAECRGRMWARCAQNQKLIGDMPPCVPCPRSSLFVDASPCVKPSTRRGGAAAGRARFASFRVRRAAAEKS